MKDQWRWTL